MKLVEFTKAGASKAKVYINPDQVAYVRTVGNQTHIFISAFSAEGKLAHVAVNEKTSIVVASLTKN